MCETTIVPMTHDQFAAMYMTPARYKAMREEIAKLKDHLRILANQHTREERAALDAEEFEDEDNWADNTTFAEAYDSIIADARRLAAELLTAR